MKPFRPVLSTRICNLYKKEDTVGILERENILKQCSTIIIKYDPPRKKAIVSAILVN